MECMPSWSDFASCWWCRLVDMNCCRARMILPVLRGNYQGLPPSTKHRRKLNAKVKHPKPKFKNVANVLSCCCWREHWFDLLFGQYRLHVIMISNVSTIPKQSVKPSDFVCTTSTILRSCFTLHSELGQQVSPAFSLHHVCGHADGTSMWYLLEHVAGRFVSWEHGKCCRDQESTKVLFGFHVSPVNTFVVDVEQPCSYSCILWKFIHPYGFSSVDCRSRPIACAVQTSCAILRACAHSGIILMKTFAHVAHQFGIFGHFDPMLIHICQGLRGEYSSSDIWPCSSLDWILHVAHSSHDVCRSSLSIFCVSSTNAGNDSWMFCASFDGLDVESGVLHVDTLFIQVMYCIMIHSTM